MKNNSLAIFWFRRDLRLEDNHGLYEALKSGFQVLPIFIFDTNILNSISDKKDPRISFIYQSLIKLNEEIRKFNSSLLIYYGTPLNAFQKFTTDYKIASVYTNHDYEPYAIYRDREIAEFLLTKQITFNTFKDQVIFEKDDVLKSDGKPYTIFTPYSQVWKKKIASLDLQIFPSDKCLDNLSNVNNNTFPTLQELGFEKSKIEVPPLQIDENIIHHYDQTRNIPSINGTTKISTHLRFGTVSIRKLAIIALRNNEQWLNELIWREFFMMILYQFPHVVTRSFKSKYDHIQWRNDEKEFTAWCNGETGYPIVDAGMRELNQTGLMHNRVRMIVASFLTKHLLIDWHWGEAYFGEKLLDYELSSNNGNWQWAAGCGCDAAPYFRIFNPAEQTRRFDPNMIYIQKWIGDMNNYKLIPIVEHEFARKRALETYKKYLID